MEKGCAQTFPGFFWYNGFLFINYQQFNQGLAKKSSLDTICLHSSTCYFRDLKQPICGKAEMKELLYLSWESFTAFLAQLDLISGYINPFTASSPLPSSDYKNIPLAKLKVLCASWSKEYLKLTTQHLCCVCSQRS